MQVKIIEEAGYNTALYGFSLSYKDRAIKREDWWPVEFTGEPYEWNSHTNEVNSKVKRYKQTAKTATANAGRGNGHDKFLRQIMLWVEVEAPRYWWSEFDTYKVGTVAQSESTMHTLMKRDIKKSDFEGDITYFDIESFNLARISNNIDIQSLKQELPEAYLQRRMVTLNYAVLRCITEQRKNHKLPEWSTFINSIYEQVEHPELLPKRTTND